MFGCHVLSVWVVLVCIFDLYFVNWRYRLFGCMFGVLCCCHNLLLVIWLGCDVIGLVLVVGLEFGVVGNVVLEGCLFYDYDVLFCLYGVLGSMVLL